jgi:hypothetical protein
VVSLKGLVNLDRLNQLKSDLGEIHICKLQAGDINQTRKMILLK